MGPGIADGNEVAGRGGGALAVLVSQHFFVEGRYLGARQIDPWWKVSGMTTRWQHSHVFFCCRCGDIWGRVLVDKATYTQCTVRVCAKHGDGRLSCPPSWFDDPTGFDSDWPSAAIRYEFEQTIAYAEAVGKVVAVPEKTACVCLDKEYCYANPNNICLRQEQAIGLVHSNRCQCVRCKRAKTSSSVLSIKP